MPLNKLERVKEKHPRQAKQIDALVAYLADQQRNGVTDYLAKLVAVRLGTSEAEALGLLMLLEEAGVLTHEYHILCKTTNTLLAAVKSLKDVEDVYECDHCGKEHSGTEDIRVELVFRPSSTGGTIEHAA